MLKIFKGIGSTAVSYESIGLSILFASILLKPFYFYPNGLPQLFHVTLAAFCLSYLVFNLESLKKFLTSTVVPLLIWIFVVNTAYYFIEGKKEFILGFMYWAYNIGIFFCVYQFLKSMRPRDVDDLLVKAISLCTVLQFSWFVIESIIGVDSNYPRRKLFFNNPNQLGYFFLCFFTLSVICHKKFINRLGLYKGSAVLFLQYFMVIISFSRASIIAASVVAFTLFLTNKYFLRFTILFATLLVSASLISPIGVMDIINIRQDKVVKSIISPRDDSHENDQHYFEYRGFGDLIKKRAIDRPFLYGEYIITGAGEGYYERFETINRDVIEIHNGIMQFFFSYGFIGLLLLAYALRKVKVKKFYKLCFLTSPIIFYNMFHNGVRDSILWLTLAFVCYYVFAGESMNRDEPKQLNS